MQNVHLPFSMLHHAPGYGIIGARSSAQKPLRWTGGTTGTPKCLDANIAFLVISDAMLNNTNTYFSFAGKYLSLRLFHEINAKTMQLDKLKVSAPSVLRMIPDELLSKLAMNTKVDYCAKVLKWERLFYLLVYAFLCADRLSQRKLEAVFSSQHWWEIWFFASISYKETV